MVLVIEQCLVPKGRVGTLVESDQGSVFTKQPKVMDIRKILSYGSFNNKSLIYKALGPYSPKLTKALKQ